MALIAHQTSGSYASFPSRSKLWTKEVKFKPFVSLQLVGRLDRNNPSSRRVCLRSPTIYSAKAKRLKVSAFKGNVQNDESGGRCNGSKISKNSVKLSSYVSHEEETVSETPDTQKEPLSYSSENKENIGGSPAIQKLFKKWLTMLRTQPSSQAPDGIFENGAVETEVPQSQNGCQKLEKGRALKAAWCYFLGLDATVKIPLLIFIPWYLAVNLVYGAEVSKELTPLWVGGPMIVALYIKLFQGICALYVFCFRQTVRIVTSLPTYCLMVYNYFAQGKLNKQLYSLFCQPFVDLKNLSYKNLVKRKLKSLKEWAVEWYLDYVESIWPYYCRTIRFLKRANLI